MRLLPDINSPQDVRQLSMPQLKLLAREIREYIISTVSETGGHLAPNLGAVELTLALHYALDTPTDKLVFDVGHQCYAHKLITGRREQFSSLRQKGGLSGFCNPEESEYDVNISGHASNSISLALGLALARDLNGEKCRVAAVIGDGALTGGMAFEALNQAGDSGTPLIVVLNDNEMWALCLAACPACAPVLAITAPRTGRGSLWKACLWWARACTVWSAARKISSKSC